MPRKNPIPPVPDFAAEDAETDELERAALTKEPTEDAVFVEMAEKEEPEPVPTRALVASAADHHLVVGMATLANMNEDEFRAKLDVMKRGVERVKTIMREVMTESVDYGKVPGIAKPFLHQPGAELLSNLYGLAVHQEPERIVRREGDDPGIPPFAFVTKSYVHLGSTDGPVIAEGSGEANPYEDKYHYRWAKQACPVCGKSNTIIARKTPPSLAGKKQCANFGDKGGCGTVFEPTDPRLAPSEREVIPDTDLWGLAETILAMSAKRSLVAAIRRATGTSGLFTQDDDSPSVQRQSSEAGGGDPDAPPPTVDVASVGVPVAPGGKTSQPTKVQMDRLKVLAKEKGLNGAKIADLLSRLFGMDVAPTGAAASAAVATLNANQLGQLLLTMETGELPDPTMAPSPGPNTPTLATPPAGTSTGDEVPYHDIEAAEGSMADHAAH